MTASPAAAPERPRILYVAGTGRSGSTILAQWLEAQLNAVHVGEMRYLWTRGVDEDHLCECGQPFSGCPFWTEVLASAGGAATMRAQMARLTPRVDRQRHVAGLTAQAKGRTVPGSLGSDVAAYADVLVPVYAQVHRVSGAPLIVDSSKDYPYLFALHATGRIDLTTVHLVRDSRAVAYSWTRAKVRPEVHWERQVMRTLPPTRSARRWLEINLAIEAYRRLWPGGVRVRYEDFAADPESLVDRVIAATGAARRADPGQPADRHSFSGNPSRFDRGPLRVSVDAAWSRAMSRRDRRMVTALTAPLLKKYGYPMW